MIRGVNADQRAGPRSLAEQARPAGWVSRLAGRVRTSPYYPALAHPLLRRVLPGAAMSALGDGMSAVAIAWLALKLAPEASRGLWVGAAVAAYSLPGVGLAVIPLGLDIPLGVALAAFFAGACIWGPWTSLSMAVLQDASSPAALAQVIAAPLGTALGGPMVAAVGARGTLLASGLATVVLALVTAAALATRRARRARLAAGR
jgi:hypothetical protein